MIKVEKFFYNYGMLEEFHTVLTNQIKNYQLHLLQLQQKIAELILLNGNPQKSLLLELLKFLKLKKLLKILNKELSMLRKLALMV